MNGRSGVVWALVLAMVPFGVQARQPDDPGLAAAVEIVGLDMLADALIGHCEAAAPSATGGARGRWRAWRQNALLPQIEKALGPQRLAVVREKMAAAAVSGAEKFKAMGPAAQNCPKIAGWLDYPPYDVRKSFASLYGGLDKALAAHGTSTSAAAAGSGGALVAGPAQAGAVYYTPAQLTALVRSWWGPDKNYDQARRMAQAPIYIQGKVHRAKDSYFLVSDDGVFRSRMWVSTGMATDRLAALEGQLITIEGEFTELPGSLAFMRKVRIVDPAGLKPATISDKPGLARIGVGDKVLAVPGQGVKPVAIHGLLYENRVIIGGGLSESVLLLLKDGTFYSGEGVTPDRLDVARSRQLEPQLWGRWRKTGAGYEVQEQDDFGAPGEWRSKRGFLTGSWSPGQTLEGAYNAQSFTGSLMTGGVHQSTTYVFTGAGRFERLGFAQGGSGSMAAMNGFVASSSSLSTGKGTTSSAGGGGEGVFAGAQGRRDDGASHRGSYRLNGVSIELSYDDGRTETVLCVPWGDSGKSIYMAGRTFSRK
ncbi:hypothetical protein [Caulobacter endophyticus]|uniref:hypothetical protein n=1 Tax=Caulobacter endophyticus TaxID=2172652 RepID=UPI00240F6550|nr:hypothetical protein [Caulobacter endophyticus]MDG2529675.1 hypothetical protein [Caulobacter endophyticus]